MLSMPQASQDIYAIGTCGNRAVLQCVCVCAPYVQPSAQSFLYGPAPGWVLMLEQDVRSASACRRLAVHRRGSQGLGHPRCGLDSAVRPAAGPGRLRAPRRPDCPHGQERARPDPAAAARVGVRGLPAHSQGAAPPVIALKDLATHCGARPPEPWAQQLPPPFARMGCATGHTIKQKLCPSTNPGSEQDA